MLTLRMICLLSMFAALAAGCHSSKHEAAATPAEAAVENSCLQGECPKPQRSEELDKTAPCQGQKIPSYELVIRDLSAQRCDQCHNETFAWKGIILTQYEGYKTYVKPIRNRVFYNLFNEPLSPEDQKTFLNWIDHGMPQTEDDCRVAAPATGSTD